MVVERLRIKGRELLRACALATKHLGTSYLAHRSRTTAGAVMPQIQNNAFAYGRSIAGPGDAAAAVVAERLRIEVIVQLGECWMHQYLHL